MDLLERYLQSVRFWLPRGQQDDIVAELSEDIRSQMEEQEAKLGHKLNEAEVAAILKQRGRPLLVANRYLPQQHLIGPALFPVYRFVLIIVALCYLAPWFLTWVGLMLFDPHYKPNVNEVFGLFTGKIWVLTFIAVGAVTIVFAILESVDARKKILENWDPLRLPAVRDPGRIPRINSAIELAANVAFSVWWVKDMWSTVIFDRAGTRIAFAPVWRVFLWIFLTLAVANIILAAVNLVRPYWTWLRASIQLALTVAGSVAFCALLKENLLAQIVAPNLSAVRAAQIVDSINGNAARSFPFAVLACLMIIALSDVGRFIRLRSSRRRMMQRMAVQ